MCIRDRVKIVVDFNFIKSAAFHCLHKLTDIHLIYMAHQVQDFILELIKMLGTCQFDSFPKVSLRKCSADFSLVIWYFLSLIHILWTIRKWSAL